MSAKGAQQNPWREMRCGVQSKPSGITASNGANALNGIAMVFGPGLQSILRAIIFPDLGHVVVQRDAWGVEKTLQTPRGRREASKDSDTSVLY